jgi:large subunit ribosomal protein L25
MLPAIVYGGHQDPEMIAVGHNALLRHLEHEAFYSHVLTLKVGEVESKVVLKDLQRHPAKPFVLHADFLRVSADENLALGDILHLSELPLPAGVALAHAPDPDVPVVIMHSAHTGGDETAEGEEAPAA